LVVSIMLLGAIAAFTWSSRQPVQYQGVVRLYLEINSDEPDPGSIVRTQAEFITSPEVLDRTVALERNRLSRKELEQRLTVEPGRDNYVITITVLDGTRAQAGALAEHVARRLPRDGGQAGHCGCQAGGCRPQRAEAAARR
jgi:capsular polysaccharide biosynthesis protein